MGLLDHFRPDVSEGWPAPEPRALVWDVRAGSLDGVTVGAPAAALASFGKPDNPRPSLHGRFVYYELGLIVELEYGAVDYMGCIFADLEEQGFAPCRLVAALEAGEVLQVSSAVGIRELLALLGPPDGENRETDESVYTWRTPSRTIELELTGSSRLARINLMTT